MSATPGPWKPLRGIDDDETRWIVVAAGADREYLIATIENGQPGDCLETEAATAVLVSSAPDLLAELKSLRGLIRDLGVQDADDSWNDAVGRADALITKLECSEATTRVEGGQ